ncbi:hypothetical protein [Streptomyces sp. NPDC048111]|uniref:hypothetical protein n=1 Tax=Streptomyces sp. NPDC048111 TaxID=3365500 RepID=UPI003723F4BB
MHADERARAVNGKAPRPTAAPSRPTGRGGAPGLLALQAGAGNTAVIQTLRTTGHAWAQPRATSTPAVQRVVEGEAADGQVAAPIPAAQVVPAGPAAPAAPAQQPGAAPRTEDAPQTEAGVPPELGEATEATGPKYLLQIQVSKSSRSHRADFSAGGFGHAWVALYSKQPGRKAQCTTYGFFPATTPNGLEALKTVPGTVLVDHDKPDRASAKLDPIGLTEAQAEAVKRYASANSSHAYNLLSFNCTSFARGLYKAATGLEAPGVGLPILENPNLLQDKIKQFNDRQKVDRKGPAIKASDNSDSETDSESDEEIWHNHRKAPVPAPVSAPTPVQDPAVPARPRFEIE